MYCTKTLQLTLAIYQHPACTLPVWSLVFLEPYQIFFSDPQMQNEVSWFSLWIFPWSFLCPILHQLFLILLGNQTAFLFICCLILYSKTLSTTGMLRQLYPSVWTTLHWIILTVVNWYYSGMHHFFTILLLQKGCSNHLFVSVYLRAVSYTHLTLPTNREV